MRFIGRLRDSFGDARLVGVGCHETDGTDPYTTCWGGADFSGWEDIPQSPEEGWIGLN